MLDNIFEFLGEFLRLHSDALHSVLILCAVFVATICTRFLPFWIFGGREIPPFLDSLGRLLPPAMIGMILVYCFKSVELSSAPFGLNEVLGVAIVATLYLASKMGVIAVIGGTICYTALVQTNVLERLF